MAAPTAPNSSAVATRRAADPLRVAGVVFAVALLVHGADHFRRGMDVITPDVFWLGNLQIALSIVTLVLVFRGHRWAPAFAVVTGFASAVGFSAAHLVPHWSAFSDAFTVRTTRRTSPRSRGSPRASRSSPGSRSASRACARCAPTRRDRDTHAGSDPRLRGGPLPASGLSRDRREADRAGR